MTTSEFWDLYSTKDELGKFELTCELFSKDLPDGFTEESDTGELLIETRAHQESAKNFENVLRFTDIVRENHPDLYLELFEYFDDFLVDYYCYLDEEDKVKKAFANFLAHPTQNLDHYLLAFCKLVYYQHTTIIQEAVTQNFDIINEYEDSYGNPEYDLAAFVYYETLEKFYFRNPEKLDREQFSEIGSRINYEFEGTDLDYIEKGVFRPRADRETILYLLKKDPRIALMLIEGYFLHHMYEKGFKFYLSGDIWTQIIRYWRLRNTDEETNPTKYFRIDATGFEEFLFKFIANSWFDNSAEVIEVLWGSVYVYEFLYQLDLINQKIFENYLAIFRKLKGRVIGRYSTRLWNANFVHEWEKPDCISETEFRAEEKIFRKSLHFTYEDTKNLPEHIREELSLIGPLAEDIKEGMINNQRRWNKTIQSIPKDGFYHGLPGDKPYVRSEEKVGRNDPCPCGSGKKYKKCCGKH